MIAKLSEILIVLLEMVGITLAGGMLLFSALLVLALIAGLAGGDNHE